ncbi:MAG: methyltransferase domain-containing protein [Anaerolineae bacterium]|nr:methyltransferase domain-containing protein [Anaerolineae bacterium]
MESHLDHAYDRAYYLGREGWLDWRTERDHLVALAVTGGQPGARVLDVGAGAGGLAAALAARGVRVFCVETERAGLDIVRARLPAAGAALISETSPALPFAPGSFDALVAQHAVEHLPDIAAALAEWRRVLRPGARAVVATPNARYPDPAHFEDPHHVHIFTLEELAARFAEAGFIVEQAYTLFPYLPRFRGRGRLAVWLSGLSRRLPYWRARGRTLMLGARRR